MKRQLSRRAALTIVGSIAVTMRGKPVSAESQSDLVIELSAIDRVLVRYRGRQVTILPAQLMDALGDASVLPSQFRK